MTRSYGFRRDPFPEKLFPKFESLGISPPVPIPPMFDFSGEMVACYDQGQTNSCTANAGTGAVQFINNETTAQSRMFVYYNERLIQGTTNKDDGATMGCVIQSLKSYGICDEIYWPFNEQDMLLKPPVSAYGLAKKDLLINAYSVSNIDSIKLAISQKIPVIFGMSVYSFFESAYMSYKGILQLPGPTETYLGGHALLICGYDDSTKLFHIRNSWGPTWGLNGYFYAPYDYITNPNLACDFYAVAKTDYTK
jgi:C1A family cysteine protease